MALAVCELGAPFPPLGADEFERWLLEEAVRGSYREARERRDRERAAVAEAQQRGQALLRQAHG